MPNDPEGVVISSKNTTPLTRTISQSKEYQLSQMENVHPLRIALDLFILAMVFLPVVLFATVIYPYKRGFYCDDDSIRYPYKASTVHNILLYIFGICIPISTILIVEAYRTYSFEPRCLNRRCEPKLCVNGKPCNVYATRLYYYIGFFLFGAALSQTLTDIAKYTIGRLRPHFIEVCDPDWSQVVCNNHSYVEEPFCRGDPSRIREGRLSFPSGHSSFGFYSMMFAVYYLQAQVTWPISSRLVKHVIQFCYICIAFGTALSRVSNYKHHWSDVLAGSLLGIVVSTFVTICLMGLFRYPKQRIEYNGLVAPNVEVLKKLTSSHSV